LAPRLKKKSRGDSTFLFAKEIFSIGERTFGTSAEKKISRRLNFSIRERTFGTSAEKKISRGLNFSIRDSYRRKNFWHLG